MSRIAATFERLARAQRKALIPFFTAGDPALDQTLPLMRALVEEGADLLELGVPFSDPMADGPTIQRANERALRNKVGLQQILAVVAEFRAQDDTTPVVLMGYANPVERMGAAPFAAGCAAAGVDGVLVVDYPPVEARALGKHLAPLGIDSIFLLAPTSTAARVAEVAAMASGYIYYVSLRGVTGAGHIDVEDVTRQVARVREMARVPVGVGFGIRDGETARQLAQCADAVVVGSRIVETIEHAPLQELIQRVRAVTAEFRQALDD